MNAKYLSFSFLVIFVLTACNPWNDLDDLRNENSNSTLFELCQTRPELSVFTTILQKTGYDELLQNEPSLTVFAPNNDALTGIELDDTVSLKMWIQDYIAELEFYLDENGDFEVENIQMINEKYVSTGNRSISGTEITHVNITGKNGVVHVIDDIIAHRMNIWEYLSTQNGYQQLSFIQSEFREIMDYARSVQVGVDLIGRPVYDTAWIEQNDFLSKYPLENENEKFTLLLIDNGVWNQLLTKYEKYFHQKDALKMQRTIRAELAGDLVLKHTTIENSGRYASIGDVLVDIDPADITEHYQASNGVVYKLNEVNIKFYQNKIKDQIIDANDYVERYPVDPWVERYRPWAMGGNDIVLKGITVFNYEYNRRFFDVNGADSLVLVNQQSGQFKYDGDNRTNTINCYLKYEPILYSTDYEIAWNAYDDVEAHRIGMRLDLGFDDDSIRIYDTIPMQLHQKLMLSFPEESIVRRTGDGFIANNFSPFTCMGAVDYAGINQETTLTRYRKSVNETESTSNYVIGFPPSLWTDADDYGQGSVLKCPTYGQATFLVTNTFIRTSYTGMIFLNYIRIKPIVDPDD
jgi:uncharacterized surface protein with fasciclin (FAS1) repeats